MAFTVWGLCGCKLEKFCGREFNFWILTSSIPAVKSTLSKAILIICILVENSQSSIVFSDYNNWILQNYGYLEFQIQVISDFCISNFVCFLRHYINFFSEEASAAEVLLKNQVELMKLKNNRALSVPSLKSSVYRT